jgi:hypothetical protein
LVIGAQGVLGSFIARGFREAGYVVIRGGRRLENAEDFRLVDLDRPGTVIEACREADLVVSTVRHPGLAAERSILGAGGVLLNLDDLPADERARLSLASNEHRGLVVDRTGLGGVTGLAAAELLERHPEADTLEFGITASARETAGRAGGVLIRRMLGGSRHLETASVVLPKPFGHCRCLSGEQGAIEFVAPLARGRKARFYLCFRPAAFNALFLGLNALRVASRLPEAAFTIGRSSVPLEPSRQPTCHWVAVSRAGVLLARRVVVGNGDYRSTVGATLVFAEALLAATATEQRRRGVFGIEELLALREILPALEARGIRVDSA